MPAIPPRAHAASSIHCKLEIASLNAHLFKVTLTVKKPAQSQRLCLPVWIPGSYLVREFSKNLQRLQARQGQARIEVVQLDKANWQVDCDSKKPLVLSYEIYALDNSVRTAWLDASRGFFNGTSMFLRVAGQTDSPHELQIAAPPAPVKSWQLATGLAPLKINKNGFGSYRAANYDELADCPVEMGNFWRGAFKACGVPHQFVVAGAPPTFDGARLLADVQKICEAEIRFWHPQAGIRGNQDKPPHQSYLFMLNAVDEGYGGLEHRNSTALICNRKDLPRLGGKNPLRDGPAAKLADLKSAKQPEGYATLLGLVSHEYFHTWNVKHLRPVEFDSYDYGSENYTRLLWFFEGFTSYYDDLMLRRAGLIDDAAYLKLVNKTINQVLQTPGREVQSVAQSSFDAWVKYYRQDENTANATVSYYTKGALVALCLDLTLRSEGQARPSATLDAVMRALWLRCKAGPMHEADLAAVLQEVGGRSFAMELAAWAHGTGDLPLKALLEKTGVAVSEDPAQFAQVLGLRVGESNGVQVKTVLRGGAAESAGFASGDEWLGLEVEAGEGSGVGGGKGRSKVGKSKSAWRIHKLDDVAQLAGQATQVTAIVARDRRILRLPLTVPNGVTTWRLVLRDAALAKRWLGP